MPLFNPTKRFSLHDDARPGKDSALISRLVSEQVNIGGSVMYVWLLEGHFDQRSRKGEPGALDDELGDGQVQDAVLLETRDRRYSDDCYRLRGAFRASENQLDFARFGMLLANDVLQVEFATADVESACGRRIIVGDVVEVPAYRDVDLSGKAANRFYSVQSVIRSPSGWDHMYKNHVLAVTMRPIKDAQEFIDIMERESGGKPLSDSLSNRAELLNVTARVQAAAEEQSYTTWYDTTIIYIDPDTQEPERWTDDGLPPNGQVVEQVSSFPVSPTEGQYALRVDMYPRRLYRYQSGVWLLKEVDRKREWGTYNWVKSLREHMSDQTQEDGLRPWQLKSIHDIATPRQARSDPSPSGPGYEPLPDLGSWRPLIVLPPTYPLSAAPAEPSTTTVTLPGGVASQTQVHTSLDAAAGQFRAVLVQYTAERDTGQRVGELLINDDGSAAALQHEFTDTGSVGLTFYVGVSSGTRYLRYTSTPGNPITLRFRVRDRW